MAALRTIVFFALLLTLHCAAAIYRYSPPPEEEEQAYSLDEVQNGDAPGDGNGFFLYRQQLDHFHPTNTAQWEQLYYIDDQFYKPGGPVFLYIGGEGNLRKPNYVKPLQWIKWGNQSNALLVKLEHRYYGISQPFKNMTADVMRYLTIDQALADIAMFRGYIMNKKHLAADTKWIAFGGSYPGALAAWLRMTYPHLIHGSIASSAPVLATAEFSDYLKVVTQDMNKYCSEVVEDVHTSFLFLESLMKSSFNVSKTLKDFKFCPGFNSSNEMDQYAFFEQAMAPFQTAAQYGKMPELCAKLKNDSVKNMFVKMQSLMSEQNYFTYFKDCISSYDGIIKFLTNTDSTYWDSFIGTRQWLYQTCTEVGYYQTSRSPHQRLGQDLKLKYFLRMCNDAFGLDTTEHSLSEAIITTNVLKGGLLPSVSNVMFVNGLEDPWHVLSVLTPFSNEVETVTIEDAAHCKDMLRDSVHDSDELIKARKRIYEFIKKLIRN